MMPQDNSDALRATMEAAGYGTAEQPHEFDAGSVDTGACQHRTNGKICGQRWDAAIHRLPTANEPHEFQYANVSNGLCWCGEASGNLIHRLERDAPADPAGGNRFDCPRCSGEFFHDANCPTRPENFGRCDHDSNLHEHVEGGAGACTNWRSLNAIAAASEPQADKVITKVKNTTDDDEVDAILRKADIEPESLVNEFIERLGRELRATRATADALAEALREFGRHKLKCGFYIYEVGMVKTPESSCDCGLIAALARWEVKGES